jgi:hypothetical protein
METLKTLWLWTACSALLCGFLFICGLPIGTVLLIWEVPIADVVVKSWQTLGCFGSLGLALFALSSIFESEQST